jgi:hypothetical protein
MSLQYTYFSNAFLATLHTSLTMLYIYCRYKSAVPKLIILQMPYCTICNHSSLYFIKYSPCWKMCKMKAVYPDETYSYDLLIFCSMTNIFGQSRDSKQQCTERSATDSLLCPDQTRQSQVNQLMTLCQQHITCVLNRRLLILTRSSPAASDTNAHNCLTTV